MSDFSLAEEVLLQIDDDTLNITTPAQNRHIARSTVYRCLEKMIEDGIGHKNSSWKK